MRRESSSSFASASAGEDSLDLRELGPRICEELLELAHPLLRREGGGGGSGSVGACAVAAAEEPNQDGTAKSRRSARHEISSDKALMGEAGHDRRVGRENERRTLAKTMRRGGPPRSIRKRTSLRDAFAAQSLPRARIPSVGPEHEEGGREDVGDRAPKERSTVTEPKSAAARRPRVEHVTDPPSVDVRLRSELPEVEPESIGESERHDHGPLSVLGSATRSPTSVRFASRPRASDLTAQIEDRAHTPTFGPGARPASSSP